MPEMIEKLRPKIRRFALALIERCREEGFEIQVVRGVRTTEEQEELYAQGRTRPGEIITHARGGYSFHNYGVAFDVRPITDDPEEKKMLYQKAGALGQELGLEWGGAWEDFYDPPHFQYTAEYSKEEFLKGTVDWTRFD
jgi:peptidoglycan L-alanyl-D-glutamate endopeptidase CwlK